MRIRTRMGTSLDGYISNADGLPVQLSLGSERPPGIPDEVVVDGDPERLLELIRGPARACSSLPRSRPVELVYESP